MQINPYLNFNGTCEEAFRLYESALGGKITVLMTHGSSPMADQTPPELKDKIMHVCLEAGNNRLMGSDAPMSSPSNGSSISIALHVDTAEEADKVFSGLSEGGKVIMPLSETFWADRFGMLVDRFGISWMINLEKKQDNLS